MSTPMPRLDPQEELQAILSLQPDDNLPRHHPKIFSQYKLLNAWSNHTPEPERKKAIVANADFLSKRLGEINVSLWALTVIDHDLLDLATPICKTMLLHWKYNGYLPDVLRNTMALGLARAIAFDQQRPKPLLDRYVGDVLKNMTEEFFKSTYQNPLAMAKLLEDFDLMYDRLSPSQQEIVAKHCGVVLSRQGLDKFTKLFQQHPSSPMAQHALHELSLVAIRRACLQNSWNSVTRLAATLPVSKRQKTAAIIGSCLHGQSRSSQCFSKCCIALREAGWDDHEISLILPDAEQVAELLNHSSESPMSLGKFLHLGQLLDEATKQKAAAFVYAYFLPQAYQDRQAPATVAKAMKTILTDESWKNAMAQPPKTLPFSWQSWMASLNKKSNISARAMSSLTKVASHFPEHVKTFFNALVDVTQSDAACKVDGTGAPFSLTQPPHKISSNKYANNKDFLAMAARWSALYQRMQLQASLGSGKRAAAASRTPKKRRM